MNKKLLGAIMFTIGAAVGSVVTWKVVKTRYEQIANEEIASVRDEFSRMAVKMKKDLKEATADTEPQDDEDEYYPDDDERDFTEQERQQVEYYKITSKYRSSGDEDENDKEGDDEGEFDVPFINGPYVISPDDFACSPPGYNAQTLDYFADGVLADDWGVKLDIEETIGEENLVHFGEYADDILYIRNERTEIDYEVTRDPRTYQDKLNTTPDPYYGKYEN